MESNMDLQCVRGSDFMFNVQFWQSHVASSVDPLSSQGAQGFMNSIVKDQVGGFGPWGWQDASGLGLGGHDLDENNILSWLEPLESSKDTTPICESFSDGEFEELISEQLYLYSNGWNDNIDPVDLSGQNQFHSNPYRKLQSCRREVWDDDNMVENSCHRFLDFGNCNIAAQLDQYNCFTTYPPTDYEMGSTVSKATIEFLDSESLREGCLQENYHGVGLKDFTSSPQTDLHTTCSLSPSGGNSSRSENSFQSDLTTVGLIMFEPIELTQEERYKHGQVDSAEMAEGNVEFNAFYSVSPSLESPFLNKGDSMQRWNSTFDSYSTFNDRNSSTSMCNELRHKDLSSDHSYPDYDDTGKKKRDSEDLTSSPYSSLTSSNEIQGLHAGAGTEYDDTRFNGTQAGHDEGATRHDNTGYNERQAGAREDIDLEYEKELIVSKMLGKRTARNVKLEELLQHIVKDSENDMKKASSIVGSREETFLILRRFQRRITSVMNSYCKENNRRVRYLPEFCKQALNEWVAIEAHQRNPYPHKSETHHLAKELGLSDTQVEQWFENYRVRNWKPSQTGIRKGKFFRYPIERTAVLKDWILEHKKDPNPKGKDLDSLIQSTGMTSPQIKQWCYNFRRRHKSEML